MSQPCAELLPATEIPLREGRPSSVDRAKYTLEIARTPGNFVQHIVHVPVELAASAVDLDHLLVVEDAEEVRRVRAPAHLRGVDVVERVGRVAGIVG